MPTHMYTSTITGSKHMKEHLDPLVCIEVKEPSAYVSVDTWMPPVLRLSQDALAKWTSVIEARNFFKDNEIRTALDEFCRSSDLARYVPLSQLLSRLLVLADIYHDELVELTAAMDISDAVHMKGSKEPSEGDVQGKPDAAAAREAERTRCEDRSGIPWNQATVCFEVIYTCALTEKLEKRRSASAAAERTEENSTEPPQSAAVRAIASGSTSQQGSERRKREVSTQDEVVQPISKKSKLRTSSTRSSSASTKNTEIQPTEEQMASQALETSASTSGNRQHNIWVSLRDDKITFWYSNASGVMRTKAEPILSMIDNFEKVAAIFIALSCSMPTEFGASPRVIIWPPENELYPAAFLPVNLKCCTIDLSASDQTGSDGAAPEAPAPGDDAKPVVVTLGEQVFSQEVNSSRHVVSKTSEVTVIEPTKNCAVVHYIPEIYHHKDIHKLSDGIHKHFFHDQEDPYGNRVLQCTVTDRYVPLRERLAKNPDSIKTMVRQILTCIHDLRYKAHLLHRDVNPSSIMWTSRGGEDCFILNDSDLAVVVDESGLPLGPIPRHRTAKLSFMSPELLREMHAARMRKWQSSDEPIDSVIHCIRMDYESTVLVAVWSAMSIAQNGLYKREEEAMRYDVHSSLWEFGDYEFKALTKEKVLHNSDYAGNLPLSPLFAHLRLWFKDLLEPFGKGERKRQLESDAGPSRVYEGMEKNYQENISHHPKPRSFEDYETLYGEVTLQHFIDILDKHEEEQAPPASEIAKDKCEDGAKEGGPVAANGEDEVIV